MSRAASHIASKAAGADVLSVAANLAAIARQSGRDAVEACKRLLARDLTARLDPTNPFDAQLLSALERWTLGDHT